MPKKRKTIIMKNVDILSLARQTIVRINAEKKPNTKKRNGRGKISCKMMPIVKGIKIVIIGF